MESAQSPRLARPDPREAFPNFDMLAQSNVSMIEFACKMVLAAPDLPPKYCSELQAQLNFLTCAHQIAVARPENEPNEYKLSQKVLGCLRIWDMAFQIRKDPTQRQSGKQNRSSLRNEAGKFAANSFDIATLETEKLDFLFLLGYVGIAPVSLAEFDKLYERFPDRHKAGAKIRTSIQHRVAKDSVLSRLSAPVERSTTKRDLNDLGDADCERAGKRFAPSDLSYEPEPDLSWNLIDYIPEFDLERSLYDLTSDNHPDKPA